MDELEVLGTYSLRLPKSDQEGELSALAKLAREMTHHPYKNPYGGLAENLAVGVYESPGQTAALLDFLGSQSLPGRVAQLLSPTNTTLKELTDRAVGLEDVMEGYHPETYTATPALQGLARLAGNVAGDPLEVLPLGWAAGRGAKRLVNTALSSKSPMTSQFGGVGTKQKDIRNLLVQHKLTADNLRQARKIGGLPMPSIAVARKDIPMGGYGEITLIGRKEMVKPGARNPVFSADAYSPTYPRLNYKYDYDKIQNLNKQLSKAGSKVDAPEIMADSLDEGTRSLREQKAVMAQFLQDKGVDVEGLKVTEGDRAWWGTESNMRKKIAEIGQGEYDAYVSDLFNSLEPEERIFFGYTDMGNRRYKPHTLENVVKRMKEDLKDSDQTNMFGAGALRASIAPRFRNLSDIKAARNRIKPPEELNKLKEELNERLIEVSHKFDEYSTYSNPNPFIAGDVTRDRLIEIAQGRASYDEYFPGAPDNIKREWEKYMQDLIDAPTGYFEAKPQRAVGINEFEGAIIPKDTPQDVVDILKDAGLRIEYYADEVGEKAARNKFQDLMFGTGAGALGLSGLLGDQSGN